jgi:hypothetical protein
MTIAGRLNKGTPTRWDDLRFPVQGINPAGSASPPTVDTSTYPGTLLFATNGTNIVAGVAQMPHGWVAGTAIRPHLHWAKTTSAAGGVAWQFCFAAASIAGTFGAYSDWIDGAPGVADDDTADLHALSAFGDIDMSAIGLSGVVLWQVRRKHDAAADTYAADARLLEVDFHYQLQDLGTDLEYS